MSNEADGTIAFIEARRRLERAIEGACADGVSWAGRVAAGIRAGLELVEDEPDAGRVLVEQSANRGRGWSPEFAAMIEGLEQRLEHGAPAAGGERTARNTVLLAARQVLLHIETRPGGAVTEIAPDLIVFALTPYVGMEEARLRSSVEIGDGNRRRK